MTEVLFTTIIFVGLGFLIGKLFKNLNPFLMFIGFVILLSLSPAFIEANNTYYTICFVIGGILNFSRPVTAVKAYAREAMSTLSLRKQSMNYADDISAQKKAAEEDLQRQKREAEEAIKRAADDLKREKEEYQRSKQQQESNNAGSNSSSGQRKSNNNKVLNPKIFADACAILWMNQDRTLSEYKKAHIKLIMVYHTDKLKGLSPERLKEAEEESKQLNVAMDTIENKFK